MSTVSFTLKMNRKTKRAFQMISQLPRRMAVLYRVVPLIAARQVQTDVVAALPPDKEWRGYRDGLETVRISGTKREPAYAVQLSSKRAGTQRVRKIDAASTVIYVRSKRRLAKASEAVRVLERNNPWTLDTLPFSPSGKEARLISKKVSKQAAARVARRLKRDKPFWSAELQRAGKKEVRKDRRLTRAASAKPRPEAAFPAIGLEFGIGRVARPHWRPAILPFTRNPTRAILKAAPDLPNLLDPSYRAWKRWGPRVKVTISKADAKKFTPFQTKLGL